MGLANSCIVQQISAGEVMYVSHFAHSIEQIDLWTRTSKLLLCCFHVFPYPPPPIAQHSAVGA